MRGYGYNTFVRIIIGFPMEKQPGLRAEATQLALGLQACGHEVIAVGDCDVWRAALRASEVTISALSLTESARNIASLVKDLNPHVVHTFGLEAAHRLLPAAALVGAGSVASLGHQDVARVHPSHLRHASTIFVPCDHLSEQLRRRLPSTVSVTTVDAAVPPPLTISAADRHLLAEELGVVADAPLILLADNFHSGETEVARLLIEATPLLSVHMPEIQLLIVGAGKRLGELVTRATEINAQLDRRAIILPGYRDDLAPLFALATVAIGSGRFAAEAQAAGVALIAAGAAGLIGTVTEENADSAQRTCYGRHGRLEPATVRGLASEIIGLFNYADHRQHFAQARQAALLSTAARSTLAERIAKSYRRSAPSGTFARTPRRLTAILPDDLRELLFTLPAVSALRTHYPQATLHLLTNTLHRDLLTQMGQATQVLLKPRRWCDWPALLRAQLRNRTDLCLAFTEDPHTALLALSSLAPNRWGFLEGNGNICLSDHLHSRLPASPARALQLIHSLEISAASPIPPPVLRSETQETVQLSLLAAGVDYEEPLLLLCPQVEHARAWPIEHWIALSSALLSARSERVAVLGAPEVSWPDGVVKVMPVQDSLVLATLLARATLVVAPDSAALHLADILGIPTIGLFGPSAPEEVGLPDSRCHALYEAEGMMLITPEIVVEAIAEALVR